MITTLPPTTSSTSGVPTHPAAHGVPASQDHPWLPYALGALIGLLVVLTLAAWAYLTLSNVDFTGVVDLSRAIQP